MQEATPTTSATIDDDDARLASLGYNPQLNRVLGLFSNFSVAFTYLSPIVGVFSLFVLGAGSGGPAYVWTTWLPVAGMLLVEGDPPRLVGVIDDRDAPVADDGPGKETPVADEDAGDWSRWVQPGAKGNADGASVSHGFSSAASGLPPCAGGCTEPLRPAWAS